MFGLVAAKVHDGDGDRGQSSDGQEELPQPGRVKADPLSGHGSAYGRVGGLSPRPASGLTELAPHTPTPTFTRLLRKFASTE